MDHLEDSRIADKSTLVILRFEMIQMFYRVLSEKNISVHPFFNVTEKNSKFEQSVNSVSDMKEWIYQILCETEALISKMADKVSFVEQVKNYIEKHMEMELSRAVVAGAFYMSPDYITRVFKRATGMTINNYIQDRRIERAKFLLENSKMSISDISLKVGYGNFAYFSTIFKRSVSMTPNEYRKKKKSRDIRSDH